MENKEILENFFNTIFPVTKKDDIDNLFLELIRMIDNVIYGNGFINLDIEDMLFSIRMGNSLKNRIECRFMAGAFRKKRRGKKEKSSSFSFSSILR